MYYNTKTPTAYGKRPMPTQQPETNELPKGNEQRVRQHIAELQEQWELMGHKLAALERDKILAENDSKKLPFELQIQQLTAEREQLEQQLREFEAQLPENAGGGTEVQLDERALRESQGCSILKKLADNYLL